MPITTDKDILHLFSPDLAWKYKVCPEKFEAPFLHVMIAFSSYNESIKNDLEILTGYEICLRKENDIIVQELLNKHYRVTNANSNQHLHGGRVDDNFLLNLVFEAKALNSSDIHIETYKNKKRIRLRIDGKLIERHILNPEQYLSFINKIKIKSQLDIAEKRLPQDGRMNIRQNETNIDIRVSILPSLYGEKVVLRLLNNDSSHISLSSIGLTEKQVEIFQTTLKKPHGIILISGPTGSGKTTTLYGTLKLLNNEHSNILTIEDPIEYTLDGINQVQLKENIGLTFSTALRTFLRQDPDIIMLGEIRDPETAQMAIRAALTGHLVLSTIHTNSAWSTVSRLIDMGVQSFLLASTINLTAAQRLVRKLCNNCKKLTSKLPDYLQIIDHEIPLNHYVPSGCEECYHTGYSGRTAIFEIIAIDTELSEAIRKNISDVSEILIKRKIPTLKNQAIELVDKGVTSIEEIFPILLNH